MKGINKMNEEFLRDFLDAKIFVKWNTQDELDHMADLIDLITGQEYDRKYMRGYTTEQYGYWGMSDLCNVLCYCVWSIEAKYIYTPEEFIAMLGVQDEQVVDISSLL